jgi:hypothetical protein
LGICRIASGLARRIRICALREHIRIQPADKRICMPGSMSGSPGCKWERRWSTGRTACRASTGSPPKARIDALPVLPLLGFLLNERKR